MAYLITDSCVSCGSCAEECPAQAIREGDTNFIIDSSSCTGCGTCAEVCPTEAIKESH